MTNFAIVFQLRRRPGNIRLDRAACDVKRCLHLCGLQHAFTAVDALCFFERLLCLSLCATQPEQTPRAVEADGLWLSRSQCSA